MKSTVRTEPIKILEAPKLKDDFYLNLLDWSPRDLIGISLENGIFLWNTITQNTHCVSRGVNQPFQNVSNIKFSSKRKFNFSNSPSS